MRVRNWTISLAALSLAGTAAAQSASGPIRPQAIRQDVRILSSDAFAGRAPGERGEEKTLAHLRAEFQKAGLEPGGAGGSSVVYALGRQVADIDRWPSWRSTKDAAEFAGERAKTPALRR
jgi:hypothetical protein